MEKRLFTSESVTEGHPDKICDAVSDAVLYALMEHNIQRLLAYHTLENIGIILLGLGAFVTGVATRNSTLMVLGATAWVVDKVYRYEVGRLKK